MNDLAEKISLSSASSEETFSLAVALGRLMEKPCRMALCGDLGAGKTLFAQGFARGLGVAENVYVTSPSYTLINAYTARLPLYHADLYRLSHSDEIFDIGLFELMASHAVTLVEWAERMEDTQTFDIRLHIEVCGATGRKLHIQSHGFYFQDLIKRWQQSAF